MRPFLRNTVQPPEHSEWHATVESLRTQVEDASSQEALASALGRLGDTLRCRDVHLPEAIDVLTRALSLAKTLPTTSPNQTHIVAANWIRLATAQQYANQHDVAMDTFRDAVAWIDASDVDVYKDFALQHMGKCLVELGDVEAAKQCFERAMRLRIRKGDLDLQRSTQEALNQLAARILSR